MCQKDREIFPVQKCMNILLVVVEVLDANRRMAKLAEAFLKPRTETSGRNVTKYVSRQIFLEVKISVKARDKMYTYRTDW
jgi:hypothetical protein